MVKRVLFFLFFTGPLAVAAPLDCHLLLVPGALGSSQGAWSWFVRAEDYFAEYREFFKNKGCEILSPQFPLDATIEERAFILRETLKKFAPGKKIAIIAHSQGGLDARYALKTGGDTRVSALLTIGCPHGGSELAQWAANHRARSSILYWGLKVLVGYDLAALKFLDQLTPRFLEEHRDKFGPVASVRYASAQADCKTQCYWPLRWLSQWTGHTDGDGMVSLKSQKWGEDLGVFDLDHLSEINRGQAKRAERARLLEVFWEYLQK